MAFSVGAGSAGLDQVVSTSKPSPASRGGSVRAMPAAADPPTLGRVRVGLLLLTVFLLHLASITLRPTGSDWSVWWPASGVAVGLASRITGRASWPIIAAIALVSATASLVAGRELLIVIGAGLGVGMEVWVGRRILRTKKDRTPRLDTGRDLVRLFLSAPASAVTIAVFAATFAVISRGSEVFLPVVLTTVPAHAVGILLVAPLMIEHWEPRPAAERLELIAIWATFALVLVIAFGIDVGISVVFLVIAPLAWAAVRLSRLAFQWMMVVTAVAASFSDSFRTGPFVGDGVDPRVTALVVQLFDLSFGLAFLTLIVAVTQRRRLSELIGEREDLLAATFDSSPIGMAIVTNTDGQVTMKRLNPAGHTILDLSDTRSVSIADHLDEESVALVRTAMKHWNPSTSNTWQGILRTPDGRSLDLSIASLPSSDDDDLSVQFLDVTDQIRARAAAEVDLARAGEVQRSLLPQNTAPLLGYEVSGICVPAHTVGGDFYDWYPVEHGLAFTLGDVMGKGVGAGMIAATARAALRSARREPEPTVAVARAADTLETEVAEADSFATLFHARLRASDGTFSFVDAGHGLAFVVRADGTDQRISGPDLPLGALPGWGYTSVTDALGPGDMLVVVSDGMLDLYDGTLATLDIVADMARRARTPAALVDVFAELALLDPAPDDVTVLAIRRHD